MNVGAAAPPVFLHSIKRGRRLQGRKRPGRQNLPRPGFIHRLLIHFGKKCGERSICSCERDPSSFHSAHSSRRSRRVALTGFLPLSHASRRAAGGSTISPSRYASTSAAHFSCHSSLRTCLPCVAARRSVPLPQNCSFLPPPAAVTVWPLRGTRGSRP